MGSDKKTTLGLANSWWTAIAVTTALAIIGFFLKRYIEATDASSQATAANTAAINALNVTIVEIRAEIDRKVDGVRYDSQGTISRLLDLAEGQSEINKDHEQRLRALENGR